MKCVKCKQEIMIHDNIITKETNPITINDLTQYGMIYSQDGLRGYSNTNMCEVCNDERLLDKKELRSYRLRLLNQQ